MTKDDVLKFVLTLLEDMRPICKVAVTATSAKPIWWDDLNDIELLLCLEEEFNIRFDADALEWTKVQDIVNQTWTQLQEEVIKKM